MNHQSQVYFKFLSIHIQPHPHLVQRHVYVISVHMRVYSAAPFLSNVS